MGRSRSKTRRQAHANPRGTVSVHRGGYGFVRTAEGEFYVPASAMNGAFDGDLVELAPSGNQRRRKGSGGGAKGRKNREARVVRVVDRAHDEVIGRYEVAEPFGVVVPEDPGIPYDIFTQLSDNSDIPDGAIVRVSITTYPSRREAATGVVIEVLGDKDDERVPIDLIVARYKLETSFSEASLEEASHAEVDVEGALARGYRDLRERIIFTIDPADARDFDDAVSMDAADELDGAPPHARWRLGVHIADVSHYVPWASSIDLDARRRATSVYLVDRVIPMLPEALSNDVCSLRPHETRRAMTVDLWLGKDARVLSADVYPSLIKSCARLTYEQAQDVLESSQGDIAEEVVVRLRELSRVATMRLNARAVAGGLDFETVEAKVSLDNTGAPVDIVLRQRTDATQLIEEAMIAANEAVARFLRDSGFPCMYRVHEKPTRESLEGLVPVLQEFPWFSEISADKFVAGNPHEIAKVLSCCADRSEEPLVTTLVLRSMQRALYDPDLNDHYALASSAYCHFTSPIRRYPDLIVHRMLKAALWGRSEKFGQEVTSLRWLAEHSSEMERVAEKAARDSQEVKIIELMEAHVGERFSALIVGVAPYGLFVRLDNTAEGLIDIADLGREYFVLDAVRHTLTGSDTGKQYRLGKRVAVRLSEADCKTRRLRFKLV